MSQCPGVADAAFHLVHDFPGGAVALGQRMGKRNLSDEVNPNLSHAKLGLLDAVKLQLIAGDYRILYAMALELGHMPPMPLPGRLPGEHLPSVKLVGDLAREFGELMGSVAQSLGDGEMSDNELAEVSRQWGELLSAGQALLTQLTAMNEAAKPAVRA